MTDFSQTKIITDIIIESLNTGYKLPHNHEDIEISVISGISCDLTQEEEVDRFSKQTMLLLLNVDDSQSDSSSNVSVAEGSHLSSRLGMSTGMG